MIMANDDFNKENPISDEDGSQANHVTAKKDTGTLNPGLIDDETLRQHIRKLLPEPAMESRTIDNEVIRQHIRNLISEPEPESWITQFSYNPLVIITVSFFLIGVICIWFIDLYFSQQSRSSPSLITRQSLDEINRLRVGSIGDVWQKADLYEASLRSLLQSRKAQPDGSQMTEGQGETFDERCRDVERLESELSAEMTSKRFWIGEQVYEAIEKYGRKTRKAYVGLKIGEKAGEMEMKIEEARGELNQMREKIFKGEIQ